jgi:hypothetical protein
MKKKIAMNSKLMNAKVLPAGDIRFLQKGDQHYVNIVDLGATMRASIDLMNDQDEADKKLLRYFTEAIISTLEGK